MTAEGEVVTEAGVSVTLTAVEIGATTMAVLGGRTEAIMEVVGGKIATGVIEGVGDQVVHLGRDLTAIITITR
jgi:hypothetical protein